jgi:copper chaperone CopZ
MSYYIHSVPGRLRVKIPFVKGNPNTAADVSRLLEKIDGIDSTAVNTLTGSVLINYDSKSVNSDKILNALTQKGYVDPSKTVTNDAYVQAAVSKAGGVVSKALLGIFLNMALEGSPLSLLTVLI